MLLLLAVATPAPAQIADGREVSSEGAGEEVRVANGSQPQDRDFDLFTLGQTEGVLQSAVSVEFEEVPRGQALEQLAAMKGLSLAYSRDLVSLEEPVSVHLKSVPFEMAVQAMLEGSSLQFYLLPPNHLTVVPKEVAVAAPAQSLLETGSASTGKQQGTVAGIVTDSISGQTIPGVNIMLANTTQGAATDAEGRYEISGVEEGTYDLMASYVGYATKRVENVQVSAGDTTFVDIALAESGLGLEELVVVGYGEQRKETLTGSVSVVSGENLEIMPVTNVSNTLGGNLPGVVAVTGSGEPGYDGSTIRIRGNQTLNDNSPLVVIDGVPNRSGGLGRLNSRDIESISVLKDASAAIYGAQAANGVILVTTKRGQEGAPQFSIDVNQGFNQPTRIPEMADAPTYLTMLNEIDRYQGNEPRFSEEEIQNYREGSDPWLYPDTDWFSEVLKPVSLQTKADMSVSGGSENVQYYLSLGGLTEDGYYKNSATRYNQYSFRSNIDGQVTDNLELQFDVSGRLEDRNYPTRGAGDIFRALMRGKPHLPAYWPNGRPGPDIEYGDNPAVISTDATGYNNDERYFLQSNLALDLEIPWVEGLSVRGSATYDKNFRSQQVWRTPWTLYTWDYETYDEGGDPALQAVQRGYTEPRLSRRHEEGHNILLNLITEYQGEVGAHSYSVLLGAERQTFQNAFFTAYRRHFISDQIDQLFAGGEEERDNNGSAGHGARQNYFSRVNYDYQSKYLLELVGRYDGSYIFPEDKRYGFFPAVSVGWRISEESFFSRNVGFFQDLKLRASWGQTGNDRIDEWQYLATYGFGAGHVFGVDTEVNSIYQTRTPNPDVTWEVANQLDIGIEGSILDGSLSFELDYFDYLRTNILHYRNASVPQSTGLDLPRENIGEVASWGFDGFVTWQQQVNEDVFYEATFNGGYATNEIQYWDEPPGAPEWQRSTGSKMNTGLYYRALGVFESWEDVESHPHWEGARPGDIIYEDVDGDGEITADDRVRIEKNDMPTFTGGVTLSAQLYQFDFNVFFQGATGAARYVDTESGELGNYLAEFAENRWTPDNPNSEHPRTFNGNEVYWRSHDNTYFLRDTDYLRLKTLQLGYRLPTSVTDGVGMQSLRIYVGGFNLFTWDKFGLMDPEAQSGSGQYYPQKRTYNVGLSTTF